MTPDCAADVWYVLWKVWVLRGVVVRLWGAGGGVADRRVLSGDIFMYCRGMFWTAEKQNISWLSHQGKRRKECLRRQSINSMQLQAQLYTRYTKCHNTTSVSRSTWGLFFRDITKGGEKRKKNLYTLATCSLKIYAIVEDALQVTGLMV